MSNTPLLNLLFDKSNWAQKALAKDKDGNVVRLRSEDAVCWCLLGAGLKCYGENWYLVETQLLSLIRGKGFLDLINFNDNSTHEKVVELLKEAQV